MHDAVQHGHAFGEVVDGGAHRRVAGHVALDHRRAAEFGGEALDAALEPLGLVGERDGAALAVDRLSRGPGDRPLVGGAHDEDVLAAEQACHVTPVSLVHRDASGGTLRQSLSEESAWSRAA